jgi:HSP20 family protein
MALIRSSDFMPTIPSLNKFFRGDLFDWMNSNFSDINSSLPAVNVRESDKEYSIEVAAPGLRKDDFKVNLENGILTISSEKKDERAVEKESYSRKEFSYQSFRRSFTVPEDEVEGEKINAKYEDGILCINIPKREVSKPKMAKEIKIS